MSRLDPKSGKTTTQFTPNTEEVISRVKTADSFSDRAKKGRQAVEGLKGKGLPLGGAPPIEPGKLNSLVQPVFGPGGEEHMGMEEPARQPVEPPPQQPPTGVGSAYPVNQAMARGELDRPMSMREARHAGLTSQSKARNPMSSESIEALKKVKAGAESSQPESPAPESPAVEAPQKIEDDKVLLDKAENEVTAPEAFDFEGLMAVRNRLSSPERKKAITDRLEPLKIEDMIVKKEIRQVVPIKPGQLEVELRTFNQHEHLFCLKYVYNFPGSGLYMEELLNTCKMVCSIVGVNGLVLPEHRVKIGTRNEEVSQDAFEDKLFHIASFPVPLIADFSLQVIWLGERVNALLDVDDLKNG